MDITVVEVDFDRLECDVLKSSIKDADVQKLLPFNTALAVGDNYLHILNESAYRVETDSHSIYEGETLCKRFGPLRSHVPTLTTACDVSRLSRQSEERHPRLFTQARTPVGGAMPDRFTFADSETGLEHAFCLTLSLRAAGFRTRLVTRVLSGFTVHTVVATPRKRPNRKERGCSI